ncbi:MAG: hypothetical protein JO010_10290 [Alphaproteobacteria bacterium]|nr:hypothetical protein [Alphaproteobacteria bacterium]
MADKTEKWVAIIGLATLAVLVCIEGLSYARSAGDRGPHEFRPASTVSMTLWFNRSRQF